MKYRSKFLKKQLNEDNFQKEFESYLLKDKEAKQSFIYLMEEILEDGGISRVWGNNIKWGTNL